MLFVPGEGLRLSKEVKLTMPMADNRPPYGSRLRSIAYYKWFQHDSEQTRLPPLYSPTNDRFINLLPLLLSSPPFYPGSLRLPPCLPLAPAYLGGLPVLGLDRSVAPLSADLRLDNFTRGRLGSLFRDLIMGEETS